jgi:hypothetical protein
VGALSTHPLWTHAGSPGAQEDKPASSGDESVKTLSMYCYISSVIKICPLLRTSFRQNLNIFFIILFNLETCHAYGRFVYLQNLIFWRMLKNILKDISGH